MNNQKNILVFIDWYLPGFMAGGPIRSIANLVQRLPFTFYIVTSVYDHCATKPYDLPTGEWISRSTNEYVMYLMPGELTREKFETIIRSQDFHRYYINGLFSRSFAISPLNWLRRKDLSTKVILAPRGMLKPGALSIKPLKKRAFLFFSKQFGLFQDITWHATGVDEGNEIAAHFKNARIKTAQNVLRLASPRTSIPLKSPGQLKLVTVARVSQEKNLLGAAAYLKEVEGDVEWDVFGTLEDGRYRQRCEDLLSNSNVSLSFKGEVDPASIPALFCNYHFFYLMTLGENFGHAIAESLLSALPVIISNRTPWKHLASSMAGWDIPLDSTLVSQVLAFAAEMNHETYLQWCNGAAEKGSEVANDPTTVNRSIELFK